MITYLKNSIVMPNGKRRVIGTALSLEGYITKNGLSVRLGVFE